MNSIIISIIFLCIVVAAQGQGVRTSLDNGWRFQYISASVNCSSDDPFPNKLIGLECIGLEQAVNANSAQECEQACCAIGQCIIYQWCQNSSCNPVNTCWIGSSGQCVHGDGWVSGASTLPYTPSATNCTNAECEVSFNDSDWRTLNVPHDFVIEGTFSPDADRGHGYLPVGRAWYRLHFTIPTSAKGQSIWITFDGVYRNSYTYLNGQALGNHPSGYTSFIYDITNMPINYGKDNVLVVYADATNFEGWWYEGGGIYRHVWLTITDPLHVKPWGVFAPSVVSGEISNVSTGGQFATEAVIYFQTDVINERTTEQQATIQSVVTDSSGRVIGSTSSNITLGVQQSIIVSQDVAVMNVFLWSAEAPNLYLVTTTVIAADGIADVVNTTIGIRKVVFDVDQGLFVNNVPVKINGVCNHQDFAGCGTAVPDRINLFRVQKLKEMGANGWRMSHNPPNPELLDIIDQLGLYVMDENRNFANYSQYFSDQQSMILRDRNHPSIIMWSVCNEVGCMEGDPAGAEVGAIFKTIIEQADPTRVVGAAMNNDWGVGLSLVLDTQGINYNYQEYTPYHNSHPYQPMFGSETASCTGARGVYVTNDTSAHLAIYNADSCAKQWVQAVQTTRYIAGGFAWTGFDYKGEPTPYNWPDINSNFGTIDIAGFPKDTFYYYQSWYTNNTVLHVFPHWNWQSGANVTVYVYTNCKAVELFLNGASLGVTAVPPLGSAEWVVPWVTGEITAKGYDVNNITIATQTIETTGEPSAILLEIETSNTIFADGHDAVLVAASIVDDQGRVVPTASNYITFEVANGAIYGVGNGDPSCHEPDKASGRSAFAGLAAVIVQSLLGLPGDIVLTASSPGLQPTKLTFTSV